MYNHPRSFGSFCLLMSHNLPFVRRTTSRPCPTGTACTAHTLVSLGRGCDFPCLLRPLRRLLFFRCQGRFLLRFFLLCAFLGYRVRSQEHAMLSSGHHLMIPRGGTACPQASGEEGCSAFWRVGGTRSWGCTKIRVITAIASARVVTARCSGYDNHRKTALGAVGCGSTTQRINIFIR